MQQISCPTEEQMRTWLLHPEEWVAIQAMERFGPLFLTSYSSSAPETARAKELASEVGKRAEREAQTEGVLWNPVLDCLLDHMAPYLEILDLVDERFLMPLMEWVREQRQAEALHELRRYSRSNRLQYQLSQNAPVVDERLVDLALSAPEDAMNWTSAPGLEAEQGERMLVWALTQWSENPGPPRTSGYYRGRPQDIVRQLIVRFPLPPSHRARVFQMAAEGAVGNLIPALLRHARPTPEELEQIWETAVRSHVEDLAAYPDLQPPQLKKLAHRNAGASTLQAIARNPTALAEPEVVEALLRSKSLKVADALFQSGNAAVTFQVFPRYLELRPREALQAILDNGLPSEVLRALTPEALLPVLSHPAQGVRLLAIQASAHLAASSAPSARAMRSR